MKKEDFIKLGLTEDLATKCETESIEELKGFIPKSRFDEVNEEKKTLTDSLKTRDAQLETLKNSAGLADQLKIDIAKLQADNATEKETFEKQIKNMKISNAVETALIKAGAKNITAVKALIKLEAVELKDEGTIIGLSEQVKALSEAEDSKFLFSETIIKGITPGESGDKQDNIDNPWSKEHFNLTKQGEIYKRDPELAKKLIKLSEV